MEAPRGPYLADSKSQDGPASTSTSIWSTMLSCPDENGDARLGRGLKLGSDSLRSPMFISESGPALLDVDGS